MADKNLDGNGLSEVWVRAAQLVKKYTGAVDSTKGDLQTQVNEKLSGTDDTKDNVITFTSADETNPTAWKNVNVLSSKEKHLSLLNKISTMFSNVRYLYKILGTTDISALGTVTQAIATLNGNVGSIKGISSSAAITTQGQYALDAREKNASIDGTLANELSKVNSNFDKVLFSGVYNTSSDIDTEIDDVSNTRQIVFGHSGKLFEIGLGYFSMVITFKSSGYTAQIAIGDNGNIAFRFNYYYTTWKKLAIIE